MCAVLFSGQGTPSIVARLGVAALAISVYIIVLFALKTFSSKELHHVREGKHGARSTKQAIAIGLSKARQAGVKLPAPKKGKASAKTRSSAKRALAQGRRGASAKRSAKRARAVRRALRREGHSAASRKALSRQAHSAARKRTHAQRSAAAKKAVRTKGPAVRSAAARKAVRTRARHHR